MRQWWDYVRPRLFTGDLVPSTYRHHRRRRRCRRRRRRRRRRRWRRRLLPSKDGYYLRETKAPSFVGSFCLPLHFHPPGAHPIALHLARFLDSTLASAYRLSLHISFGTGDRTPRVSSLPSWQSSFGGSCTRVFAQVKCSYNAGAEEASSRWLHSIRRRPEKESPDRIRTRFPSVTEKRLCATPRTSGVKCDAPDVDVDGLIQNFIARLVLG